MSFDKAGTHFDDVISLLMSSFEIKVTVELLRFLLFFIVLQKYQSKFQILAIAKWTEFLKIDLKHKETA
jgi:hypothetical protein